MIAPAKVNLYLAVGGRRPDGYHDVDTVVHTLAFGDEVTVEPSDSYRFACEPDLGLPEGLNLAHRAAVALTEATGARRAVSVSVRKHVPAGAGLGGGSSDAAAVLRLLAETSGMDPDDAVLRRTASEIGADVPFFLGGPAALLAGRGDSLVSELRPLAMDVALVWPGEPLATNAAYAAFDRMLMPLPPGPGATLEALAAGDVERVAGALYNNLTEASVGLVPAISEALALLACAQGALGTAMAGSGSAVFGIFEDARGAIEAADVARERGWWAAATSTVGDAAEGRRA